MTSHPRLRRCVGAHRFCRPHLSIRYHTASMLRHSHNRPLKHRHGLRRLCTRLLHRTARRRSPLDLRHRFSGRHVSFFRRLHDTDGWTIVHREVRLRLAGLHVWPAHGIPRQRRQHDAAIIQSGVLIEAFRIKRLGQSMPLQVSGTQLVQPIGISSA